MFVACSNAECFLRAFPCRTCRSGLLLPLPLTQSTIEAGEDSWRCNSASCGSIVQFSPLIEEVERALVTKFEQAHAALARTKDVIAALEQLESVIGEYADSLMHRHHYLLLQIYMLYAQLLQKKLDSCLPPLSEHVSSTTPLQVDMAKDQRETVRKQIESALRYLEPLERVVKALLPSRHPLQAEHYADKANLLRRLLHVTPVPSPDGTQELLHHPL